MVKPSGIITLLTDFGTEDAYVGAMKGAILQVHPKAVLVDLTHHVRSFAILQAAFLLDSTWRTFPAGTVHLTVVDPGVGTERRAMALEAAEHFFVGPDNGVFTFLPSDQARAVVLQAPSWASPTFHGRDVFAPAAARLAAGASLAALGTKADGPSRLDDAWAAKVGEAWRAYVLHCDHFGNVITNLPGRALPGIRSVNGQRVQAVRTYGEAPAEELVVLVGSSARVEVALRGGSAAARLRASPGEILVVT